jgi:phosphatidylglycerophosphate synthase
MAMLARVRETYRRTTKPRDILWNRLVARPIAALLVAPLERTRVTPNQITLASLFVFLGAVALLLLARDHRGLVLAVVVLELSYVLDCADGQLARLRGTSSPVGAHLDFLMDELKAFLLVAATGIRLWQAAADPRFLIEGLVALVAVAAAISLTTFLRRPEYVAATGAQAPRSAGDYGAGFDAAKAAPPARRSPLGRVVQGIEALGRLVVHYPSYLVIVAAFDRLDIFLHAYLFVNAAHAARSILGITLRLGRFASAPANTGDR